MPIKIDNLRTLVDVDTEITSLTWLKAIAQTGLTGDKTGSFNLTTTGTLGAGNTTITGLLDLTGLTSDVEFFKDEIIPDANHGHYVRIYRQGVTEAQKQLLLVVDDSGQATVGTDSSLLLKADGYLALQYAKAQDIYLFPIVPDHSSRTMWHFGYLTSLSRDSAVTWKLDDTDDYFHLGRVDVEVLGFKIDMPVDLGANNLITTGTVTTDKLGVGNSAVPKGGIGIAKLAIDGTTVGNALGAIQQTAEDNYPICQYLPYSHDNMSINFDSYWDGAWRSSDAGSNFQIQKTSDKLYFRVDDSIIQGGAITWADILTLGTNLSANFVGTLTVGATTTYPYKLLVAETGITPEDSQLLTTDAFKGRAVSVQGNGGSYYMGRDVTNNIEFIMGTSTTGVVFLGSVSNHDLTFRANNTQSWSILASTKSFVSGADGTAVYNITTAGTISSIATVNQTTNYSLNGTQTPSTLLNGSAYIGTDTTMTTKYIAVKIYADQAYTMGDFQVSIKYDTALTNATNQLYGEIFADDEGSPSKPTGSALATGSYIRYGNITSSYVATSLGTSYTMTVGKYYWLILDWGATPTGGNIILNSDVSTNMGATSTDGVTWTNTNARLYYKVRGKTALATYGYSTNNRGVYGISVNNYGVYGTSTNTYGVYGISTNGYGVRGVATYGAGVYGTSTTNYGGYFTSTSNSAIYGNSTSGNSLEAYSTGTGRIAYLHRNSSTSSLPLVYIYAENASDINTALYIRHDGTGALLRLYDSSTQVFTVLDGGFVGIQQPSPTAYLHLGAGTATAGTAPLKLTSGTVLTAAEAGAIEFTTDDFFATITTGVARKAFILDDGTRLTSGKIPVATTNGRLIDVTAQTELTDEDATATDGTDATQDQLINNMRTRINELETKLVALGLLADAD